MYSLAELKYAIKKDLWKILRRIFRKPWHRGHVWGRWQILWMEFSCRSLSYKWSELNPGLGIVDDCDSAGIGHSLHEQFWVLL